MMNIDYYEKPHNFETVEELRKLTYEQYIKSKWWYLVSRANKKKKCQECNRKHELDVHHLRYDNLGDEKPNDLITLCRRCHRDLHYFQNRVEPTKKMVLKQYQITSKDWEQWQTAT